MDRDEQTKYISSLLAALALRELGQEEKTELDEWRKESPENERLYRKVESRGFFKKRLFFEREHDLTEAYGEFQRMAADSRHSNSEIKRFRRKLMICFTGAAASVLFLVAGYLLFHKTERADTKIFPGNAKIILTTYDGHSMDISDRSYQDVIENAENDQPDEIIGGNSAEERYYNTITVPRGGEYLLNLSDGTRIYVNAESEIKIPAPFLETDRIIEMQGEAFFDVANNGSPFVVKTPNGTITVTGTSFNVRDYADEPTMETTLVTGSVLFGHDRTQEQTPLQPGEQLSFNKESLETEIRQVNTRIYTVWTEGRFLFVNRSLGDIMSTLARWYDIEVEFEEASLKDLHFTGNIERYEDLESVLKMLILVNKVEITGSGRVFTVSSLD